VFFIGDIQKVKGNTEPLAQKLCACSLAFNSIRARKNHINPMIGKLACHLKSYSPSRACNHSYSCDWFHTFLAFA
jgi:hypothetical protein